MYKDHEKKGEIMLQEMYGSSAKERFYVKLPDQENIVAVDLNRSYSIDWLTRIFLPQGYPDSVSKDYMTYQIWDTAQAFCSTITGTLATQEVLRGVGVGDTTATALAATVTWVIKDGCGHLGRIIFAYTHGSHLDAYSKKWRLYADTLNDAAMCIEISLPLFKNYTRFALCVSTVMKAIVGVAGGATRIAMTQHHAVRGNLADVSAKDSAQETAVNLIASVTALLIISLFGNSLFLFVLMIVMHIAFNYLAVRAVCLRALNEPRFLQVIDTYLKQEIIANPCQTNRNEPIIFYQLGPNLLDLKICGFQIKMGYSLKEVIRNNKKAHDWSMINDLYKERNYMLYSDVKRRIMYVLLKDGADTEDILCSYFHAVLLAIVISAINDVPLGVYQQRGEVRPFAEVCRTVRAADWCRDKDRLPSLQLLTYVDKIAIKEWQRVRAGLLHTGWDLSKHLLVVDEWRISKQKTTVASTKDPWGAAADITNSMNINTVEPDHPRPSENTDGRENKSVKND